MSFLKFWGKKGKKEEIDPRKDDSSVDPEAEKRRLRHSLSISRSGRFKQRKRERGQILDKPELFDGHYDPDREQTDQAIDGQNAVRGAPLTSPSNTSPSTKCRDVNHSMATGPIRTRPSVVT